MQRVRAGVCVAALLPGPRAQRHGKPYYGARCLLLRRRRPYYTSPRLVRGVAHLVRAGVIAVRAVLQSPPSAATDLGLRVHVVGAGVHVQLAERCDLAHEVRLTRPDVELRCYTQNDGSAQPRRGGGSPRRADWGQPPAPCRSCGASCGWDYMWSQRATLAASFGSVVRAMRQAHRLLHGTRGRAPRKDRYEERSNKVSFGVYSRLQLAQGRVAGRASPCAVSVVCFA